MLRADRTRGQLGLALLLLASGALGCVEYSLSERIRPTEFPDKTPPAPPPATDGAIWRGETASGSFLFFDRKARGVGDLVTVVVSENTQAAGRANTNLGRDSSIGASLLSDIGFTGLMQTAARKVFEALGAAMSAAPKPAGEDLSVVESQYTNSFTGDGETVRSGTFTGIVTCRVVDVLPGGLFHIVGRRKIVVNHELQLITVEGLVRREDISIDNIVPSSAMAEALLTYDGVGVIDDKQRPALLARVLDWVYPF